MRFALLMKLLAIRLSCQRTTTKSLVMLLLCFAAPAATADGFLDNISGFGKTKLPVYLPVDQAFSLEVMFRDADTLLASFSIAPEYYLYRDKITFKSNDSAIEVVAVNLPRGDMKSDPTFGQTEVFHQSFQAEIKLKRSTSSGLIAPTENFVLTAVYQGCSDLGLCYPPVTKTLNISPSNVSIGLPTPSVLAADSTPPDSSESSTIADLFLSGNFWLIVTFFFGAGLLLSFTPCVFPMVPILSGIIVGRGHNITHMHAFVLSLAYVLGMAITYAAAGVAAGYSGQLISNALQTPWVLGSFAGVFVLLSLSMFGFYELQLPSKLQSKLTSTSNKLPGGHLSGVFVMGALSAIIMGPCVAAPLAGALLYIGQSHDALLGGVALFALAMGMGTPLLLIGTSAGVWLPKAGAWMEAVKRFFGVLLLALAIWIIQPLLSIEVHMLLWATLLILSGIYMHALEALPHNANGWRKLLKGIGLLSLLLGVAFLIGALSGANDILRPLGNIGRATSQQSDTLKFTRIKDSAELDSRIAQANGQTVMLDFYADWCISCKEMERFTFTDAGVQAKLSTALLLQADVTANNAADQALLKRFGLYGPPGILFFDAQGKEQTNFRVIGHQNAEQFIKSLQRVGL